MHADVFDEKSRPGLPTMPRVDEKMPHRGLVDQFEVRTAKLLGIPEEFFFLIFACRWLVALHSRILFLLTSPK